MFLSLTDGRDKSIVLFNWRSMQAFTVTPDWIKSGLFWRTFLLMNLLVLLSMLTWFGSFTLAERTPKTQQLAANVSSIVRMTATAIRYCPPQRLPELFQNLASVEGISVYNVSETDQIEAPDDTQHNRDLIAALHNELESNVVFAKKLMALLAFGSVLIMQISTTG